MTNKSSGINVGGMLRWAFGGLVLGFIVGLFALKISWTAFLITITLFIVIFGFIGAKSKRKEEKKASQFISNEGLTTKQKAAAWIFSVINPVITGAVMYYMWRYKYPAKARQANHISIIVLLIELAAYGVYIGVSGA